MQQCAFWFSGSGGASSGGNAASAFTIGWCICRSKNGMCLFFVWFVVLFSFLPCDKGFLLRHWMPFFPFIFLHGYTVIQSHVIEQQFSFLILNMNRKISLVYKQIFSFAIRIEMTTESHFKKWYAILVQFFFSRLSNDSIVELFCFLLTRHSNKPSEAFKFHGAVDEMVGNNRQYHIQWIEIKQREMW